MVKNIYEFEVEVPLSIKCDPKNSYYNSTKKLKGGLMIIAESEEEVLNGKLKKDIKQYVLQTFKPYDKALEEFNIKNKHKKHRNGSYKCVDIVPVQYVDYSLNSSLNLLINSDIKYTIELGDPEIVENEFSKKKIKKNGEYIDLDNIKKPQFFSNIFYYNDSELELRLGLCVSKKNLESMAKDGKLPEEFIKIPSVIPLDWYRTQKSDSIITPEELKKSSKIQNKIVKKLIDTHKNHVKMDLEDFLDKYTLYLEDHCFNHSHDKLDFIFKDERLLFYYWVLHGYKDEKFYFITKNMGLSYIAPYDVTLNSFNHYKQYKINELNEKFNPVFECLEQLKK